MNTSMKQIKQIENKAKKDKKQTTENKKKKDWLVKEMISKGHRIPKHPKLTFRIPS